MSWIAQGLCALISSTGNSKDGSSYHLLGNSLTRAKQSRGSLAGVRWLASASPSSQCSAVRHLVPRLLSTPPEPPRVGRSAPPPQPRALGAELAQHGASPCFVGHSRNVPGVPLGTILLCSSIISHELLLNDLLPIVKVSSSITHTPPTHTITPHNLASQPRGFLPPTVPSLWSVFGCRFWLRLAASPLLLSTALQETPTEGILFQSPGASFPALVQGTMLITVLHPAA